MEPRKLFLFFLSGWFSAALLFDAGAGEPISGTNRRVNAPRQAALTLPSQAYKKEALRAVLQEANQVAGALHLPETLPITETDLVQHYISPFAMSRMTGSIGNVTTRHYTYYVSIGDRFSFLEGRHLDENRRQWLAEYSWPVSRLDTNAAYQLATQWLAAVSMDVPALNADCNLHIHPTALRGQDDAAHFLPVYWVYWTKGAEGHGSVASVELFAPTKTLLQLRVEDAKYILRPPLEITNLDFLLSKTNAPSGTNAPTRP